MVWNLGSIIMSLIRLMQKFKETKSLSLIKTAGQNCTISGGISLEHYNWQGLRNRVVLFIWSVLARQNYTNRYPQIKMHFTNPLPTSWILFWQLNLYQQWNQQRTSGCAACWIQPSLCPQILGQVCWSIQFVLCIMLW